MSERSFWYEQYSRIKLSFSCYCGPSFIRIFLTSSNCPSTSYNSFYCESVFFCKRFRVLSFSSSCCSSESISFLSLMLSSMSLLILILLFSISIWKAFSLSIMIARKLVSLIYSISSTFFFSSLNSFLSFSTSADRSRFNS